MTIDAHQHFWRLDQSPPFDYGWLDAEQNAPIRRDYLPEHLAPHLRATGIERSIFVQTQHNLQENHWALKLADEHDFIAGVVGWVDLAGLDCERQLLEFKQHPKFVGVRHVTQDEPDDDFIVRPEVLRGLKVLQRHAVPFDLLFYARHLRHAATLAERLPDLPMVIDHLAKPHIRQHRTDDWRPQFQAAARYPNVYCKLSGMITEADWRHWAAADLKPYVQTALDLFGPSRLMFGSDWPVCELAGSYEVVVAALKEALGPLSDSDRDSIFGGTASRFYKLP
jgi:L-fuconolactonase